MKRPARILLLLLAGPAFAQAQAQEDLEEVTVVAPYGMVREPDRIPADLQQADAEKIGRMQSLDLTDFLSRSFGSVSTNQAQNNPLQPNFNFRGFTASPLLGLPQGLAVYQNGVRANEPFGDTVNWDLIALSAIDDVQLLAGANPVFGLNTLGGALSVRMKDGFTAAGHSVEGYGGSFGRIGANAQSGGNDGRWGYYLDADYFSEEGWRDDSSSDALRMYGSLGYREGDSSLDLSMAYADSDLRGNGTAPVELLGEDRSAVFTHPDRTQNQLAQMVLEAATLLGGWKLAGNAYFRHIDTDAFNGDGTIFEVCDVGGDEVLVEEDGCPPGGPLRLVLDQNGDPIGAELDGEALNAINNISRRRQQSWGASVQATWGSMLAGERSNDLSLGAAFSEGRSSFDSVLEVAQLEEDRSTSRTGVYAAEYFTDVGSDVGTWSLYFVDTLDLTDALTLTLAGRYDDTSIRLEDRSGLNPELDGRHEFGRFNPAAGLTWRASPALVLYASASQSARAPTPVELACADEDAPCNLPNAFLADPPLEQVVATSFEVGGGGTLGGLTWHAGGFVTTNRDDILFQTTGGPQANVGFFANVGDTRRAGVELRVNGHAQRLDWYAQYSHIRATFEDEFVVNSPNHPVFGDAPGAPQIAGEGKLLVEPGSTIPGIPQHQVNAGVDLHVTARLSLGADANWRSGVFLRGDEANLLAKTADYLVINLRGEWQASERVTLFARVENLFDAEYESFGLLGEPGEVLPELEDPRFLGPGAPLGGWLGVRVKF